MITHRQIDGLIVLVLVTVVICLLSIHLANQHPHPPDDISFTDRRSGPVVVLLMGDTDQGGAYYLPEKTTVHGLLSAAGVKKMNHMDREILGQVLTVGQTVVLHHDNELTLGRMDAAQRLALDMPIDLNSATLDDLMLVPGVGAGIAGKILALRESSRGLNAVEDLLKINGIKEKSYPG